MPALLPHFFTVGIAGTGLLTVPVMIVMMLIVSRTGIMGRFIARGCLRWLGWAATVVMLLITIGMFATSFS